MAPTRVARALDDAFTYQAFSCEYIANLLAAAPAPACRNPAPCT